MDNSHVAQWNGIDAKHYFVNDPYISEELMNSLKLLSYLTIGLLELAPNGGFVLIAIFFSVATFPLGAKLVCSTTKLLGSMMFSGLICCCASL